MSVYTPTLTLLVPGPFASAASLAPSLRAAGVRHTIHVDDRPLVAGEVGLRVVDDPAVADAFRSTPGFPAAVATRIGETRRAAVVDVALRLVEDHAALASLGRALEAAGGLAVRMEGSGGAFLFAPWLERVESGDLGALWGCAVVFVGGGDTVFTCGMHQFGLPDAEIATRDMHASAAWLERFQLFQLYERPMLASGHTFAPDAKTPRRILERWPDARHQVGDGRHNPFGVVRFLPEGAPRRDVVDPVPVIIPALSAILSAEEKRLGRALVRDEVETIVKKSQAIALPLADAIALERSRGYADIDPELAWAQWSIVRAMG